jgi:hypothetical protein
VSECDRTAGLLRDLLGNRAPEKLSAKQLAGKAYWRWRRKQYLEAAVLFEAAATRSADEARLAKPARDNTFNYRVRSGVTYRLAGEIERAWPILVEATTFDWQAAGIVEDSHFTEWAFVEMLCVLAKANDKDGFSKLFWQAVARCAELDSPFPRIQSKQELLLELCQQLGLVKELANVVPRIETQRTNGRGKLPRRLTGRVAQLKAEYVLG